MKVAFVIEFFLPLSVGGAEWSTYFLAQAISRKGHQVTIITPDITNAVKPKLSGPKVVRYPFYLKLRLKDKFPGNFFYTNPLWVLWSAFFIYISLKKENPDVIHIHGKYSILPTLLANFFLKKPTVATIRDNIIACNYGICLMKSNKPCNILEYFSNDFRKYYKIYVYEKNLFNLLKNFMFAIWGRLSRNTLIFSSSCLDQVITLSQNQKRILQNSGIKRPITTIGSVVAFKKPKNVKRSKMILYAGRLTYGKGMELMAQAYLKFKQNFPNYSFTIAGSGAVPNIVKDLIKSNTVKYIGFVPHKKLESLYRKAALVVVPSIWPDPLPRSCLESLSQGTPVVGTNRGGIPDVVKDGVFGFVSKADPDSLAEAIEKGIIYNDSLRKNIQDNFERLKNKYGDEIVKKHISLYSSLIK